MLYGHYLNIAQLVDTLLIIAYLLFLKKYFCNQVMWPVYFNWFERGAEETREQRRRTRIKGERNEGGTERGR